MPPPKKTWSIIDLIDWGTNHFTKQGIENARREMEWFLCDVLNYQRIDLYLKFENTLKYYELDKLRKMVKRRITGEPFQHIIGKAPFYMRDFIVNNHVLIPRPETEILIDRMKNNGSNPSLLDIGTGSGCIAITCALENLSKKIVATDISPDALDVACANMKLHSINYIQTICRDFLKKDFKTKFDVVVSNPPYIGINEINLLDDEVRNYDPTISLTDGKDGLTFYRHFAHKFDDLVISGGYILLEIGGNQHKGLTENIFSDKGLKTKFIKDLQYDWLAVEVRA